MFELTLLLGTGLDGRWGPMGWKGRSMMEPAQCMMRGAGPRVCLMFWTIKNRPVNGQQSPCLITGAVLETYSEGGSLTKKM
jgi:hypothetical protein